MRTIILSAFCIVESLWAIIKPVLPWISVFIANLILFSILISGLDIVDERKALDVLFTKLRTLTEELGVSLICVAHLKRLDGNQDHTDGVQVSLSHIRGSEV